MPWTRVTNHSAARTWFESITTSEPSPPIFEVAAIGAEPGIDELSGLPIIHHSESEFLPGGLVLRIPLDVGPPGWVLEELTRLCAFIDPRRQVQPWQPSPSDEPLPEGTSLLTSELEKWPAVGPGGHIRTQQCFDTIYATVSARRTLAPRPSVWVDSGVVGEQLANVMTTTAPGVLFRLALGYHELPAAWPQDVLRPTIVVLTERVGAAEGPNWRVAHTIAATDVSEDDDGGLSRFDGSVDPCQ